MPRTNRLKDPTTDPTPQSIQQLVLLLTAMQAGPRRIAFSAEVMTASVRNWSKPSRDLTPRQSMPGRDVAAHRSGSIMSQRA